MTPAPLSSMRLVFRDFIPVGKPVRWRQRRGREQQSRDLDRHFFNPGPRIIRAQRGKIFFNISQL